MKGSEDISSDPSNIKEDNVSACDLSVTSENEQEKEGNKIMNFASTPAKISVHKVTLVKPIRPSSCDYRMKQKSENACVLYVSYFRDDRYKVLKGLLNLRCMFCGSCSPIKFDMDLHLYENHRENLLTDLPIKKKKGFRMDNRIDYAINQMESEARRSNRCFG